MCVCVGSLLCLFVFHMSAHQEQMVLKPVCLFSQDGEIGERAKNTGGWRERGKEVNTGSDGRGEKRQMDRQGGERSNKEWN